MAKKYLFYISQNYSFEILRPLQEAIIARGDRCAWFVEGSKVNLENFNDQEKRLLTLQDVIDYQPRAVFVPGNEVPDFIPGLKVQVFHGLEWKKKGHFRIRGFFDLYCTHGETTTQRFKRLATEHGYFHVVETGWPKLDPLFNTQPLPLETHLPVILFAPTFSPHLTCAVECVDEIKRIAEQNKHFWIIKFHPKMDPKWIDLYREIQLENFQIMVSDSSLPLLQRADVLVSDTSSIISEFLLLNKPAVTFKNAKPGDYLINITSVDELDFAIGKALQRSEQLIKNIEYENSRSHPYRDGSSSKRILNAVDDLIERPAQLLRKKPFNFLRNFKIRRKLNYWKF